MKNECETLKEHWAAYLYDDLPEAQATRLRRHLQNCSDCLEELDSLYKSREAVEWYRLSTPVPDLPADFSQQVLAGIREEKAQAPGRPPAWRRRLPLWLSIAAVLLVMAASFVMVPDLMETMTDLTTANVGVYEEIEERVRPILEPTATPTPYPTPDPEATPIPTLRELPYEWIR